MFSCERSHDRRYMYYCPLSVLSRGIRFSFSFLTHARSAAGSSTESAFPRRVGAWVQIDGAMLRHSHRCYRYNRCERAVETERSKSKCYSDVFPVDRPSYAAKWPKHTPPTGYTDCSV
jgi:hypothetical protein